MTVKFVKIKSHDHFNNDKRSSSAKCCRSSFESMSLDESDHHPTKLDHLFYAAVNRFYCSRTVFADSAQSPFTCPNSTPLHYWPIFFTRIDLVTLLLRSDDGNMLPTIVHICVVPSSRPLSSRSLNSFTHQWTPDQLNQNSQLSQLNQFNQLN